jgi:hypothetical protein
MRNAKDALNAQVQLYQGLGSGWEQQRSSGSNKARWWSPERVGKMKLAPPTPAIDGTENLSCTQANLGGNLQPVD